MTPILTKICAVCKQELPWSMFAKQKRGKYGLRGRCKSCVKARDQEWLDSPEGERSRRESHLKYYHGITFVEYDSLLAKQDGRCAICGCISKRRLWVDHDHVTGEIRGLLCASCNTAIGLLHDDPVLVQKAVKYLMDTSTDAPNLFMSSQIKESEDDENKRHQELIKYQPKVGRADKHKSNILNGT